MLKSNLEKQYLRLLSGTHYKVAELVLIDSHFLLKLVTLRIEMVDIPELGMFFFITLDFLGCKSELGLEESCLLVLCYFGKSGRTSAV